MSYCINPWCKQRHNQDSSQVCHYCSTPLLINGQFLLLQPLRPLESDRPTEVFEVIDLQGTWTEEPGTHKVLKVLSSNDSKLIELMQREAELLQLVSILGVPRVDIDGYFTFQPSGDVPQLYCLVLEKIPGDNLADWIELNGQISQPLAIEWLHQLVEILGKLHSFGFFHRDIKPSNIIVRPNSTLALIDFGGVRQVTSTYMAKLSRGFSSTSEAGGLYDATVIRTACFTPLEQLNGKAVPQSDFYALGRTFVYLVTGISLVNIPTNPQTGQLLWRSKAPQIDKPFADLLDEMIAPFPGQRPRNTQLILQYLTRIPFQSKLHRFVKSKQFQIGAIALCLLLIAGLYKFSAYSLSRYYFEQAARHQANPQTAKKFYQLAIQYNPQDIDAYNNLALVCQQLQDYPCVIDNYQQLFARQSKSWEGHYGLGNFYDDLGKYDLAQQQYKLAIAYSNNSAVDAITNLSRLKNINGEYTDAEKLSLQALTKTKDPGSLAASYKNLGWARLEMAASYKNLGQTKLAQEYYGQTKSYLTKAIQLDPNRIDAYCLLAQAEEALKHTNNANLAWEVCLIASSNLPEVQDWRQQLIQRIWKK